MIIMMMIATNNRRPSVPVAAGSAQTSTSTATTSKLTSSSSSAFPSPSPSPSSSVVPETVSPSSSAAITNLPLGQLGKSSNSSNETVIALEQPNINREQISVEAKKEQEARGPSGESSQKDDPQMILNQDSCNVMTSTTTIKEDISDRSLDCNHHNHHQQPQQQHRADQGKQSIGRLRSFLLLTRTSLNPFHHHQHQVKRKQSLNSSSSSSCNDDCRTSKCEQSSNTDSHRNKKFVNLFNLAQRCFFFKQSSEFRLNHHHDARHTYDLPQTDCSLSAPVTPIKWNSLVPQADDHSGVISKSSKKLTEQIPNGLGSPGYGYDSTTSPTLKQASQKPSVRFLESCNESKQIVEPERLRDNREDAKTVHRQTSQPTDRPELEDSSVANLFKLQDVVEEGEVPMNSTSFRQHGYSLIDYISNYLDTIKERRVTPLNIEPGYLKDLIEPNAPARGESFANIMHDFENHIMCGITHWQHPHFHAYFPAGNAYPSILADMLSDALGCVGFSWAASPAYTELEIIMLDWMGKMIGLPDEFLCLSGCASESAAGGNNSSGKQRESKGGGVIQGSASECVLVNLLAARHWAMDKLRKKYPQTQDGILLSKLIGYCSKEAHSCVEKAAMIGFIRMRALDTDEHHSLRGDTLQKAINMDKANGLEPFLVCATLGTTSCVSFDNLAEIGPVCRDEDIWLHVDAAYAGSALICPEFQYLMNGIELVTSFNMNPNKWMMINFDCSLMWVKDRFKLTRAFVVDPLYLQHSFSDQAIDYRHWGIPLSRRFRALKLWFVIRNYGISGLQAYIRNHVRLAKLFEQLIRQDSRFTINNQVVLGLVCFRLIGSNALNQRLLSMINASGKLHMVPASLEGRYVIRFCVCDQNAKEEDIRYAYECIGQFATELFESIRAGKERIRAISQQNTIDVSNVSLHTQQSASADRLNRMATANQSISSGNSMGPTSTAEQQQPSGAEHPVSLDGQQEQQRPARIASPNREAARQYLMASRRNSHALNAGEELQLPPGGAKSPQLQKQASMQTGASGAESTAGPEVDHDDLEQEIMLDSLASIDGYDYDLDEDDDVDEDDDNDEQEQDDGEDDVEGLETPECGSEECSSATADRSSHHNHNHHQQQRRRRQKINQATASSATGERDEAEDEVFHLAKERRNRMSLRYKREFFVRVVSDPRVYRASISGDINASCNSLGNNSQQQLTATTTTGSSSSSTSAATTTTTTTTSVSQGPAKKPEGSR